MTLLFATVEDDDICQMLFILMIRFMLLSHLIPALIFLSYFLKYLCECYICIYKRIGVIPPIEDLCKLQISHCFFHFHPFSHLSPRFKSQSLVLLNISVTQAGGGDLLIRFPWLFWLPFSLIRYTTWPRSLGCRNTYFC